MPAGSGRGGAGGHLGQHGAGRPAEGAAVAGRPGGRPDGLAQRPSHGIAGLLQPAAPGDGPQREPGPDQVPHRTAEASGWASQHGPGHAGDDQADGSTGLTWCSQVTV